jgi:hypothetical protein
MGSKGRFDRRKRHRPVDQPVARPTLATVRVSLLLAALVALVLLTLVLLPITKWSHDNGTGQSGEDTNPDHVLPVAVATSSRSEGYIGDTFTLNGSLSHAYRGAPIINYTWEFHEDWLSGPLDYIKYGKILNMSFIKAGAYYIVLTVVDKWGNWNSTVSNDQYKGLTININDRPPVAVIDGSNTTIVGKEVNLNGGKSHDDDGSVVDYQWDFGDGATGKGPSVSHAYNMTGTFTVTLTVRDDYGETGVSTVKVVVK